LKAKNIVISKKRCKKCGLCVETCPKKVYIQNEADEVIIENLDACIVCLMCQNVCPDFAIEIEKEVENAK
jgi:2-oxoglutarate ferredoxin oxidoreductase subunit delta